MRKITQRQQHALKELYSRYARLLRTLIRGVAREESEADNVLQESFDCAAKHECSVPVIEMFGKDKMWEGAVEIFTLTGHPKAERCYAWNFADDKAEPRYIAVLELPPVCSPHTAVRAAIASGQQK